MASQGTPDEERSPALTDAAAPGDAKRVSTSPRGLLKFRFLEEIRKRNVGRVAILYVVACWLILEPVHVVFHMLEVPPWANRLVIIFANAQRAVVLDPLNVVAHRNLGRVLHIVRRHRDAIEV